MPKVAQRDEGKFIELEGAEMGKVIVRFPPEASGYLHIGHAKAALLNQYYQETFKGQLIMRFDDTNPAKENAHFEKVILEDLAMLRVLPDRFTHSSDHFDALIGYCEQLLSEGKAYVDDTDAETMRKEREERAESRNRNNSVDKNLGMWAEMVAGSEKGQQCCVRIKIDMSSNNGALRDPTIYRCKKEAHVRTGEKYNVYPTYDFACPIIDSMEGVTHALRTTEYHDRDDQYYFICDALGLRKPHIWEYARLNMTHTVMSKRKLTWLVDEGYVEGWDDPRMPTVRGVMRRGMTVEGLKQFILAQGGSRSIVVMEWDKIWAFNKKVVDPVAPRYTALESTALVPVRIRQPVPAEPMTVPLHPKNPEIGTKEVWLSDQLYVEQADAVLFKEGDVVTFINWGNLKIGTVRKDAKNGEVISVEADLDLDNKDYKKTLKVTWLADVPSPRNVTIKTAHYAHIISKPIVGKDEDWKEFVNKDSVSYKSMMAEPAMFSAVQKGDIIQIQRKSFFICDERTDSTLVLIEIPDGKETTTTSSITASKKTEDLKVDVVDGALVFTKSELSRQIDEQADRVRAAKTKEPKAESTKQEIAKLLELKKRYKEMAGHDYRPDPNASKPPSQSLETTAIGADKLAEEITAQGERVREAKSKEPKADSTKEEIAKLLELKKRYKEITGQEYKPSSNAPASKPPPSQPSEIKVSASGVDNLTSEIAAQGERVREAKSKDPKAESTKQEIAKLLELKKRYKEVTGQEYKPASNAPASKPPSQSLETAAIGAEKLAEEITAQGDKVREAKAKDPKADSTKQEIAKLLDLKKRYKETTGQEYKPAPLKK